MYFLNIFLFPATAKNVVGHSRITKTFLTYKSNLKKLDTSVRVSEVRANAVWSIGFVTNTVNM